MILTMTPADISREITGLEMSEEEMYERKALLLKDIHDALHLIKAAKGTSYTKDIVHDLMPRLRNRFVETNFLEDVFSNCEFEDGMAESGTLIFRGKTCLLDVTDRDDLFFYPLARADYDIYRGKLAIPVKYIEFEKPIPQELHERLTKHGFEQIDELDEVHFIRPFPIPDDISFGEAYKKFIASEAYNGGDSLPK